MYRLQDELAFSSSLLPSVQMTRLLAYAIQLAMLVDVLGTHKVSAGGDSVIRVALLLMAAKNASGADDRTAKLLSFITDAAAAGAHTGSAAQPSGSC